ncbi:MAG: hypothetical protein WCR27_07305 [Eubacteriales bacterium]
MVCLVLVMSIVACGNKDASKDTPTTNQDVKKTDTKENVISNKKEELTYSITDETYTETGITIKFPQLSKANDPIIADSINKAIQENIKEILGSLRSEEDGLGAFTLDLNYEIAGYGNKVFAISYQGYAHYVQGAYPTNVYYTQNIVMKDDVHAIALKDIFMINDAFVEQFKSGVYSTSRTDLDLEKSGVNPKEVIEGQYSNQELISLFQSAEATYKLTENGVVVSVEVPHALGDHLEMAINYDNIEANMIKSSPVWQDYQFIVN